MSVRLGVLQTAGLLFPHVMATRTRKRAMPKPACNNRDSYTPGAGRVCFHPDQRVTVRSFSDSRPPLHIRPSVLMSGGSTAVEMGGV